MYLLRGESIIIFDPGTVVYGALAVIRLEGFLTGSNFLLEPSQDFVPGGETPHTDQLLADHKAGKGDHWCILQDFLRGGDLLHIQPEFRMPPFKVKLSAEQRSGNTITLGTSCPQDLDRYGFHIPITTWPPVLPGGR